MCTRSFLVSQTSLVSSCLVSRLLYFTSCQIHSSSLFDLAVQGLSLYVVSFVMVEVQTSWIFHLLPSVSICLRTTSFFWEFPFRLLLVLVYENEITKRSNRFADSYECTSYRLSKTQRERKMGDGGLCTTYKREYYVFFFHNILRIVEVCSHKLTGDNP